MDEELRPHDVCVTCGEIACYRCSACKSACYCSRECQRRDWRNGHKDECSVLCGVHIDERPMTCTKLRKTSGTTTTTEFRNGDMRKFTRMGSGSYGSVLRIEDKFGRPFAIKYMTVAYNTLSSTILHELEVINFNDPNIISACMVGYVNRERYENEGDPQQFEISMDLAQYDLKSLTEDAKLEIAAIRQKNYPTFRPAEMKILAYQVLRSIAVIHGRLVHHNDVKPQNFLVAARTVGNKKLKESIGDITFKVVILADFGLSVNLYKSPFPYRPAFTLGYRPPELLLGKTKVITHLADVWAAACVIYEMATGVQLFECTDEREQIEMIAKLVGTDKLRDPLNPPLTESMTPFNWFGNLPLNYPRYIPSWNDFLKKLNPHPGLGNLLIKMLAPNPHERCTIFQALEDGYFTEKSKERIHIAIPELRNIIPVRYDPITFKVNRYDAIRIFLEMQTEYIQHGSNRYLGPLGDVIKIHNQMVGSADMCTYLNFNQKCRLFAHAVMLVKRFIKSGKTKTVLNEYSQKIVAISAINISEKYLFNGQSVYFGYTQPNSSQFNWYDVVHMEREILEANEFDLSVPTSCDYLDVMINPNMAECYITLFKIETKLFVGGDDFMNKLHRGDISPHEIAALCIYINTKKPVDVLLDPTTMYTPPIELLNAFENI